MTRYGLGGTGATLAARAHTEFNIVVITNILASPGVALAYVIPPDTEPDGTYFAFGFGTAGMNFPYGFDVELDGPL